MAVVRVADEDLAVLKRVLELLLSDVRMEICDTDSADFREGLKEEKRILQDVIAQLEKESA